MSEWQTPYKVGDPDPTTEDDERPCGSIGPQHADGGRPLCTWGVTRPHGTHVCGDGEKILATWPDEYTRDRWRP